MKYFKNIISAAVLASLMLTFSACNESSSSSESQETTSAQQTTEGVNFEKEADLTKLHEYDLNGDDFAGTWKITEGVGNSLDTFAFGFDGDKTAYLLIDNVGYIGKYTFGEKDGEKTFNTQLLFGLDGTYTYKFNDDKTTVELENVDDQTKTVMQKIDGFTSIPTAQDNPKIDEELLGAWQSSYGEFLYFDKSGIMYDSFSFQYTFSNYNAEDAVVNSTYKMKQEVEESYEYEINGDELTFNNDTYQRISATEIYDTYTIE